jgi:hypothetical protein
MGNADSIDVKVEKTSESPILAADGVVEGVPVRTEPMQPEIVPLAVMLRQIRTDAARDPKTYLEESVVPLGGE